MNKLKSAFFSLAAVTAFAMPTQALAGAWTAKKGAIYSKAAINYFETSSRFGEENGFERFRDINFSYYLEYGIEDNLTFFTSTAVKDIRNVANGQTTDNFGIGDVDLGLRYNLVNEPFVFSVQGLFKAPFLYSEDADLPLGNGQIDVEGRALLGKSLGKLGYFGLEAGYRFRADDPVDEFRYLIEYGIDLTDQAYFRTKLDGTIGLGDVDQDVIDLANLANPSLPLAFDLGKLEYTVGYKLSDRWSMELSGTTNVYGNNTLTGTTVQFAIVGQF